MGKKSSKTTSTTAPPTWAKTRIKDASDTILNTVKSQQGNLNQLQGGLMDMLPQFQSMAMDTSALNGGQGYINNVLGGQYLNNNPYVENMAHMAEQDAGNAVNSAFSRAGRTGGGNNVERLAQGVANAGNTVRFQNYQNERGLQNQAAGLLPQYQVAKTSGLSPLLGAYQTAAQIPFTGINSLGQIGGLVGGYGTTKGTVPGGWGGDLLNAAASIGSAAIMASDRRLKTKIKLEFRAPDGLGWYSWNWKSAPDGQREEGVIADEVETLRPWAFVKGFVKGEFDGVDYAALGAVK